MVLEKQKYGKWIFPVLFMLYVAWTAVGAFPLLNYESDSGNLISGVAFMRATGHVSDLWDYCYDNQPLTYWVIIAVTWLTHLGAEASYCLISWLASIALAWFAVNLIHEVCGVSRSVALFAWVLMPESYACGMYANSGVLAVMAATGGMWLLWRKKYIWATVVLCVAPLLRLDVVCIYPVVFPMLWLQGMGWKKSAVWSALLALIVIAAIVTGLIAL